MTGKGRKARLYSLTPKGEGQLALAEDPAPTAYVSSWFLRDFFVVMRAPGEPAQELYPPRRMGSCLAAAARPAAVFAFEAGSVAGH